jgi:hypothetical protein
LTTEGETNDPGDQNHDGDQSQPLGLFHPTPQKMAEMQILVPLFVLPCHKQCATEGWALVRPVMGVRVGPGGPCRSSLEKDRSPLFGGDSATASCPGGGRVPTMPVSCRGGSTQMKGGRAVPPRDVTSA